ncbi:hypothetical protein [Flavobacterium sp. J27]|uniref:hypothetical protein n=1 Tax=Flavobacterium sp. J27 TaxID=2060419 RepID=UPI00102FBDE4|nr:hypothetical protein [Flavobacterium sp. J27]
MKLNLLSLIILASFSQFINAQFTGAKIYYEGEIGVVSSFFIKDSEGNTTLYEPGGLNFRGGIGLHDEENIFFLGLHSGMDANFRHTTGILPVYLNSKLALEIDDEIKLIFSFGYGKSFQIGPENLHGFLRKYTIALGNITKNDNLQSVFIEIVNHGYNFPDDGTPVVTLNFGYTFTFL